MSRAAYKTDLTDAQWERIAPLLPPARPGGRPRETDLREVLNTLFYLDRTGCQWALLPHDLLPKSTVYDYFARWPDDGTWAAINAALRERVRERQAPSDEAAPSAASVDSQTVQSAGAGGERGFDGAKLTTGRKRHAAVDTLGLLLAVCVTAASVDDAAAAPAVLSQLDAARFPRLRVIWADAKYHNHKLNDLIAETNPPWRLEIVRRPTGAKGFVLLPKRWVIERTFGWLRRCRRLCREYERRTDRDEALVQLASIRLLLNRLAPSNVDPPFHYRLAA